jgi:hypothetical protein
MFGIRDRNSDTVRWKSVLLLIVSGFVLTIACSLAAFRLADTTGDRWIPLFLVGALTGFFVFLVGGLGVVIGAMTELRRFLGH